MPDTDMPDTDNKPPMIDPSNCTARWFLFAFGWVCVGLGLIGVVVPGMPTTIFLIVALWAFSKSSERFQRWLWYHPRFGPSLRAWHQHRVIPVRAKIAAASMMALSLALITAFIAESWVLPTLTAVFMVPVCAYVLSRASSVPGEFS